MTDNQTKSKVEQATKKKVIIVGAGIAGLGAAKKLIDHGFEVTILEARHDHGGRIRKDQAFAGFPIEIGGEEIHKIDSPYHKLAVEMGAVLKKDDEVSNFFEDVEKEELIEYEEFLEKYASNHYYNDIINEMDKLEDSQSLLTYLKNKGLPDRFYQSFESFWGTENGASLKDISVKGFGLYESTRDSDLEVNLILLNMSNFDILEKAFSKIIPQINYSSPVAEINYIKIAGELSDKPAISAVDANGIKYSADYLILTVPISQLKNNTIHFNPELPSQKQDAIKKMSLGRGGKLHLKFKKRFWPANTRNIILRSKISFLWNIFHQKTKEDAIETNILLGLVAGDTFDEMQDASRRQELIDELLEKMAKVFKYPNVKQELEDVLWSDFTQIDFIEGNYSYPTLNMGGSRQIYQEPIDDVLYFAGEASHLTDAMTIHGAYETGLRDAQRIINHSQKKVQS